MKKSLKSLLAVCLAAAMAVTATGCGGSSAPASGGSSTESGAAGGEAAAGEEKLSSRDTLNMACKSEPTSLDPAQTKDLVTWAFMYNVSDSLLYFNWETQEYEPAIATEWSASDDGLEYTFTIRDGVKFHNGDTMTVDDVVFSFLPILTVNPDLFWKLAYNLSEISRGQICIFELFLTIFIYCVSCLFYQISSVKYIFLRIIYDRIHILN